MSGDPWTKLSVIQPSASQPISQSANQVVTMEFPIHNFLVIG